MRLPLRVRIKDVGGIKPALKLTIALGSAVCLAALSAFILSREPFAALRAFFLVPFSVQSTFLSMIEASAPLALCSLGVVVTFRAGHYSLGGEGQAYAGAVAATAIAQASAAHAGSGATLLAIVGAAAAGSIVAAIPAAGKRYAGADVLLTSILVSQGVIFSMDWLIGGPLRDSSINLVAMKAIPSATLLVRLAPPATLTMSPLLALALCYAGWWYFERSRAGAAHDMYGKNPRFAGLQGYNEAVFAWAPIVIAGALHGVAGAVMSLGFMGTAIRGMSGGIGWSAIGSALVAGSNPAALPFSALLFSWLDAGARQAAVLADLPPDSGQVIKAVVILTVSARPAFNARRTLPLPGARR
ncbi:MAG: ABC transporter permease [Spirochaetales bacterium]|nr:ABC transporter permease [Spirochaetales bacterium]